MIFDYFEAEDPHVRHDLQRIDNLLKSDTFLKALGKDADELTAPDDFPIITDVIYAEKMLHSQEIWDMPKPWPYQYFAEITDCIEHLKFLSYEDKVKLDGIINKNIDAFGKHFLEFLGTKYEQHQIVRFLYEKVDQAKYDKVEKIEVIESFQNDIDAFIYYLIDASYYGGIDAWPEMKRIYEAFLTGGLPCGWVGPLPEDGGDPRKCMQLLHFGTR
jgi:hypothetical protein